MELISSGGAQCFAPPELQTLSVLGSINIWSLRGPNTRAPENLIGLLRRETLVIILVTRALTFTFLLFPLPCSHART